MGRVCKACRQYKDATHFSPFKQGKGGLYPQCKECRKPRSKIQYANETPEYRLFYRAKKRAKDKRLPFDITVKDITVPEFCPVLKTPMDVPSLDRIIPTNGYVKGNIRVISNRANMLKNNATAEEIRLVYEDLVTIGVVND